jgi:hypothetical protein
MNRIDQPFAFDSNIDWEPAGEGIRRKVLTYNSEVMMVRVAFQAGAVGTPHSHPHIQCSLVEAGVFDVTSPVVPSVSSKATASSSRQMPSMGPSP